MKQCWLFALLFFLFQDKPLEKTAVIRTKAGMITTDRLQNLYIISSGKLKKYESNGTLTAGFDNLYFGDISFVDASDPFRILLYSEDFNKIRFVDNVLKPFGEAIALNDFGVFSCPALCSSQKGGFWLFNEQSGQIIRYDKDLQQVQKSISVFPLLNQQTKAQFLIEKSNRLFLSFSNKIMVFDDMANYLFSIKIKHTNQFQIKNNNLLLWSENDMLRYNLTNQKTDTLHFDLNKKIQYARYELNRLYCQFRDSVVIYNVPN